MKMRTLIGAALLLSTAGVGIALAAVGSDHLARPFERHEHATRDGAPWLHLADRDHHKDRNQASERRYRDDDDDDEDDDHRGRSIFPQTGPSDPNAPVPDNGLFQGKARPKVQVQ